MNKYAVWFTHKDVPYRLPVNPEEIKETTVIGVEKYEVLKLGEIAVPGSMSLREFEFETEFPQAPTYYTEETDEFYDANYFLELFKTVREKKEPIFFTAAFITTELSVDEVKSISTYVLIESLVITEKAGEECDKYVSFKLLEYKNYSKKPADEIIYTLSITSGTSKAKKSSKTTTEQVTPKSSGYYVVQSGDSLWSIAKKQYGDGSKCNIIYNANKDKIKNPGLISVGWKLKIPIQSEFAKYSAALPTTKVTTKTTVGKTNSTQTAFQQAGYNIQGYRGGRSDGGRSHSSGGGGF